MASECTDDDDDDTRGIGIDDGFLVVFVPENAAMSFDTSLCMNGTSVSSDCDDSRITPRRESSTRLAAVDTSVFVSVEGDAILSGARRR